MSLRVTFLACAILAVIMCLLVLPVSVPDVPESNPKRDPNNNEPESGRGDEAA